MVHLLPHWNWSSGTNVTVFAYGNCDSVELFLNDKSQGSKTLSGGALHFEWSVPWASGTLRAECKKDGTIAATDEVKTAGSAARVALTPDRSTIRADGKDMVFITADILDGSGVLVPNGNNSITFSVTGSGQLVGVDNGDATDTSSYKGGSRKAFSGKALAMVRSTKTAGAITIKATSSGLSSDPITVTAQ
jgi:beta-galactosidase